eukprot:symbB.v1.2.018001.t1/scaffold1419.1/size119806/13
MATLVGHRRTSSRLQGRASACEQLLEAKEVEIARLRSELETWLTEGQESVLSSQRSRVDLSAKQRHQQDTAKAFGMAMNQEASKEDASYAELEVLRNVMSAGAASPLQRCTDAAAGTAGLTAFGFLRETHQLCAAMRGEVQLAHRPSMLGGDRMVESLAQEYVNSMQPPKQERNPTQEDMFSWSVPIRKFKEKDRQILSPSFFISLGQNQGADFKIILRATSVAVIPAQQAIPAFSNLKEKDMLRSQVHIRVSIGGSAFLEQEHDFSEGAVARLRGVGPHEPLIFDFGQFQMDVPVLLQMSPLGADPTEPALEALPEAMPFRLSFFMFILALGELFWSTSHIIGFIGVPLIFLAAARASRARRSQAAENLKQAWRVAESLTLNRGPSSPTLSIEGAEGPHSYRPSGLGPLWSQTRATCVSCKDAATFREMSDAYFPLCFTFFGLGERLQLRTLARRWHQELEAWSGRRKKRGSRFDLAEIFIIVAKPMRIPYHSIMQASRCETGCGGVLLGRAAEKGFGGLCWRLLRMGADVNAASRKDDLTPLMCAVFGGQLETLDILLQGRADVNHQNNTKCTALMLAADLGHRSILQRLLFARADVTLHAGDSTTALTSATQKGHFDVVEELLHVGQEESSLADALWWAAEYGHACIVERLFHYNVNPNFVNQDGSGSAGGKALRIAAHKNNESVIDALLHGRANVNATSTNGFGALAVACQYGSHRVAHHLLASSADVNARALNGRTPLMIASTFGHVTVVEELLCFLADVHMRDREQNTSVLLASQSGHTRIIEALLRRNAEVNAAGQCGWTALNLAASFGHLAAVCSLLASRADVHIFDEAQETAEMAALANGHMEIVEVLQRAKPESGSVVQLKAWKAWRPIILS